MYKAEHLKLRLVSKGIVPHHSLMEFTVKVPFVQGNGTDANNFRLKTCQRHSAVFSTFYWK